MIFKTVITFFNYLYYLFLPEFVIIQKKEKSDNDKRINEKVGWSHKVKVIKEQNPSQNKE